MQEGTLVGVGDGVRLGVRVLVTVGDNVAVGVREGVGVVLGVFETAGELVTVFVGVGLGGGDVGVGAGVEVLGRKVLGGAVTKIETPTRTVRALFPSIGGCAQVSQRARKPTILGTIGM